MTIIDERAKLLPSCPFCGGAALENDGYYGEKAVYCGGDDSCPISGYAFDYGDWQARATMPTAGECKKCDGRGWYEDIGHNYRTGEAEQQQIQCECIAPTEPTAEVSEDEVVEIIAECFAASMGHNWKSLKKWIENRGGAWLTRYDQFRHGSAAALSALSDNGYKIVRK
jgi:excinuclease UvrABC ATPase subunit